MVDKLVIVFSALLGSIIIPLACKVIRLQSNEAFRRVSRILIFIARANRSECNAL